jgi:glycerophosphoryl diester phosphodiesterase
MRRALIIVPVFALISIPSFSSHQQQSPVVIAHRGASGYLPEHSLPATAMAYAFGVDYIEPDVVLTKDNQAIVLHDIHLDTTTDVNAKFPKRKRKDGRYYAIDFTLKEIKTLSLHERVSRVTGKAVFPKRFPAKGSYFRVPTLIEQIEMIQGLNKSTGKLVGIYPEIKHPDFHNSANKDITHIVWSILKRYGYTKKGAKIFIQCFDPEPLKRLRTEFQCSVPLIQLIGANSWKESKTDYKRMRSAQGLADIKKYADGIGAWLGHVVAKKDGAAAPTGLIAKAHKEGLKVHVYTARADQIPAPLNTINDLFQLLFIEAKADGVFTDHGDLAVQFLKARKKGF